ncbi:MAG: glycosyltransferase [Bacilli bacterium]|nr:glycosyltransferase [Bacilli bacterium]
MEKITIITPSYNCKKYFKETFESVINQTYKDYEWIIIDDCSTDGSFNYISNLIKNNLKIRLFQTPKNGGSAVARNIGLKNASGRYITFLDADDLLDPNYLEEQVKFINDNGPIITAGYRRIHGESNTVFLPRESITFKGLLKGNDCSCLTTMYDREVVGDIFFPEDIKKQEDYVFWLNILKQGYTVKGNRQVLATYNIHSDSKNINKKGLIKYQYAVYHKAMHFNFFKSMYYVFRWGIYGLKKYKGV